MSMPKGMREKMHAKEHEEIKRERKEKKKWDRPYFQIKDIHQKRERVMFKGVQKYLELGRFKNSTHLHFLIKVYDLHLLEVQFLTLQNYVMQVCLSFIPT